MKHSNIETLSASSKKHPCDWVAQLRQVLELLRQQVDMAGRKRSDPEPSWHLLLSLLRMLKLCSNKYAKTHTKAFSIRPKYNRCVFSVVWKKETCNINNRFCLHAFLFVWGSAGAGLVCDLFFNEGENPAEI